MCFSIFKKIIPSPVPMPIPEPVPMPVELQPCGTIDLNEMSSIVMDKLEAMGLLQTDLFLPDNDMKVYKKEDVQKAQELEEVSSIVYVAEAHDCDDFAAELFGKFAGLAWTNLHALNWFVDESNTFWFIEPQTKKLSQTLEGWAGNSVRLVLGR